MILSGNILAFIVFAIGLWKKEFVNHKIKSFSNNEIKLVGIKINKSLIEGYKHKICS